jgi:hypothetical protein
MKTFLKSFPARNILNRPDVRGFIVGKRDLSPAPSKRREAVRVMSLLICKTETVEKMRRT